MKNEV